MIMYQIKLIIYNDLKLYYKINNYTIKINQIYKLSYPFVYINK